MHEKDSDAVDYFVPALKSLVNKLYLLKMSIPCTNQTLEDVVVMMLEEKGKSIEEDVDNLYKVLECYIVKVMMYPKFLE